MPVVLRLGSLQVRIYPADHRPAHVHVVGQGHRAVFELNCPEGPLSLRQNSGFPARQVNKIATELETNLAALCKAWGKIHD